MSKNVEMNPLDGWAVFGGKALLVIPKEVLAQLSGFMCAALSCDEMTPAIWSDIEEYLADDGTGTDEQREAQAAFLAWLRAERKLGLMRYTEDLAHE